MARIDGGRMKDAQASQGAWQNKREPQSACVINAPLWTFYSASNWAPSKASSFTFVATPPGPEKPVIFPVAAIMR